MTEKKPKRARIDWDAVRRDFRTDKFTLRELEAKHGVSYAQISRKSTAEGWEKDLRAIIKSATEAALLRETVTGAQHDTTNAVLAAAEVNTRVIVGHRLGLKRITAIQAKLLAQIEQAVDNMTALDEIITLVRSEDDNGNDRANDALRKAMGRSALVEDLKKLADVDEKVRKGEREAFSLDVPAEAKVDEVSEFTTAELVRLRRALSED